MVRPPDHPSALRKANKASFRGAQLQKRLTPSGSGGIDFNKLNDTDASANPAGYLLAVVDDYQTPPSPYVDYGISLIDDTSDRSAAPVLRHGILLQVDPSASPANDGSAGIDVVSNADGGIALTANGQGGVGLVDVGDGGVNIIDQGAGGLNLEATATCTGGLNITNLGNGGLGLVDNYNSTGAAGVEIHSKKNDVNITTLVSGDVTISASANVIMASLPTSDPGISGALWVDPSGFVKQSP